MYTLIGYNFQEQEDLEHYFTQGEYQLALQVANKWLTKGYKPLLFNTKSKILFNYKSRSQKLAA